MSNKDNTITVSGDGNLNDLFAGELPVPDNMMSKIDGIDGSAVVREGKGVFKVEVNLEADCKAPIDATYRRTHEIPPTTNVNDMKAKVLNTIAESVARVNDDMCGEMTPFQTPSDKTTERKLGE